MSTISEIRYIAVLASIIISLAGVAVISYQDDGVFAQQEPQNRDLATFTASGLMASWTMENDTGVDIPYVISGVWRLQVSNGTVDGFEANITMVKGDGTDYHMHQFTNFQAANRSLTKTLLRSTDNNNNNDDTNPSSSSDNIVQLLQVSPNSTLSIPGSVDISTTNGSNNNTNWSDVSINVMIRKLHALNIVIDESATNAHFTRGHYPTIYGTVNSIKDETGTELLESKKQDYTSQR